MDIIESKTTWGRWLKMIGLCVLCLPPLLPLLLWIGYRRLHQIPEDDPNYKFLKSLLYAGLIAFAVVGCWLIYFFARTTEGENEPFVKWLPPTASNVSYVRNYQTDAHEFTVTEKDFLDLCKQRERLKEIAAPVTIERYTKRMKDRDPSTFTATVSAGLYAEWSSGGRLYKILFDRKNNRAYFFSEQE